MHDLPGSRQNVGKEVAQGKINCGLEQPKDFNMVFKATCRL
jgi:hypothetical protein